LVRRVEKKEKSLGGNWESGEGQTTEQSIYEKTGERLRGRGGGDF